VDEKSPGTKKVTVRVNPAIKDAARTHTSSGLQVSKLYDAWLPLFSSAIAREKWKTEEFRHDPRHTENPILS